MKRLTLIGMGTGDPAFVTVQAVAAMNRADVFFAFDKGKEKSDLVAVRQALCATYIEHENYRFVTIENPPRDADGTYRAGVDAWHAARAELVRAAFAEHVAPDGTGAFLVWGDPALYDSTLRVVRRAFGETPLDVQIEIIPGIGSVQILTARHKIGLNEIGEPVHITTGRQLRMTGPPQPGLSTVVMLDADLACRDLAGHGFTIYWGAALGSPDEMLVAGPLDDVIDEIERLRADLKARRGWVMDTYLLRR